MPSTRADRAGSSLSVLAKHCVTGAPNPRASTDALWWPTRTSFLRSRNEEATLRSGLGLGCPACVVDGPGPHRKGAEWDVRGGSVPCWDLFEPCAWLSSAR